MHAITGILARDDGQDLIEYALLAAFVAIAAILAIGAVGVAVNGLFSTINGTVQSTAAASS